MNLYMLYSSYTICVKNRLIIANRSSSTKHFLSSMEKWTAYGLRKESFLGGKWEELTWESVPVMTGNIF